MSNKVTVATTWLGGCSGCHISLLDTHEELLDILSLIDIKYSTIVDVKEVPEIDVGIIEGSICNEENLHMALEFRKKAKIIVALGTCACYGGIQGLRNTLTLDQVLKRSYVENETTVNGKIPVHEEIPKLTKYVMPLRDVIKVDAQIPGCAPNPGRIKEALLHLINGTSGETLQKSVCEECTRKKDKLKLVTKDFISNGVLSPNELEKIDSEVCFLEQGILCMGPATVSGCKAYCCENGNMPCKGCYGVIPGVTEQGASIVNALATLLPAGDLMFNEDIVGAGYRYTLPYAMGPFNEAAVSNEKTTDNQESGNDKTKENKPKGV